MVVGRYAEAQASFQEAYAQKSDHWLNLLDLGLAFYKQGLYGEARQAFIPLFRAYKQGVLRTADDLAAAGRASAILEQFHDANQAFRTAYRIDPKHLPTLTWWADLFREKYNEADAQRTYEEALSVNPKSANVLAGLAQTTPSFSRQEELARAALAVNPRSVPALNVLAELAILDNQYPTADSLLQTALDINANDLITRGHQASILFLKGDSTAFQRVDQQVSGLHPQPTAFYQTLSDNAMRRFRYPAALQFAEQAVMTDRNNAQALATLGTSLLRMGRRQEARFYLDRALDRDAFNLFASNTLTLLDQYENFAQLESEHFILLLHKEERDILGPRILEMAETCYADLSKRYPYTPSGKILIEAYNDADDFAVRIAGIPHLGLLGVSFGDVIALNTPRAQAGSPYNWARTLWHELAHTMAIGVSQNHVPRWYTEGLSVYEEYQQHPEWGREMDLTFFAALDQGKLLPLNDIDRGFTRPTFQGQILLSYYHASKVIAFIAEHHGFEVVTQVLQSLAQGISMDLAMQNATGKNLTALDTEFQAQMRTERKALDSVLHGIPSLSDGNSERSFTDLLIGTGAQGAPFFKLLDDGAAALAQEDYETAEKLYSEALDLYPNFIESGTPYLALDQIYDKLNQPEKRLTNLERYLTVSEHDAEAARTLALLLYEADRVDEALAYLDRSMQIEPYSPTAQVQLADWHEERGQYEQAIQARRAVLALNPVDAAQAHYRLANALFENGQYPEAKRVVLQALERAPGYRDAQKLLLKCVDATG